MISATENGQSVRSYHRDRESDRVTMGRLLLLVYPLCLLVAMTARIGRVFRHGDDTPGQSVFAEARASAHAVVGYAFHA
ncbi:hypothetical protein BCL74_2599 [Oceanibaculum indicum]|uniref:PufQ cytochrome subunit n=1 Tax=Oceanibaculum indicum TaxID=526216 RepID=A0A420WI88_9PROT|nr:hypothetical protein BCL74_2599 [Oceanibaculum indicum]